ncbi:MAG TPA: ABC transporter permease [Chloroflexota bacterium]|jgi:lipopolysaccharide transport system permease protein|nr:ABC transporter permease [Chloroflexota bacterium]
MIETRPTTTAPAGAPESAPTTVQATQTTVIQPSSGWQALDLAELWRYRELLYYLAWRDVKVRYKQTALGAAWAILQPLLAMAVFTLFFGRLVNVPSDGLPYPLFAFAGLLPWTYFANAVANAGSSLVTNTNLISKVYFPRLIIPLAGVLSGLVDFAIGLGVLVVLLLVYGFPLSVGVLLAPIPALFAVATALAVGVWLAALDVQYRDVRYATPFLLQVWLFATPVVYPASIVPEPYRPLLGLNPMAGVVEGFRWLLLSRGATPGPEVIVSALTVLVLLVSGLYYFRRVERRFADVI